jgi:Mg2+ and Co2+ transporter CorA
MDSSDNIQHAIAPLIRGMDQLYNQMQRIADRLDSLPSIYMPRLEYEARHKAIQDEIEEMRVYADQLKKSVEERQREAEARQRSMLGNKIAIGLAAAGWIVAILSVILGHLWK